MSRSFNEGDVIKGKVSTAPIVQDDKGNYSVDLVVEGNELLVGPKVEDGLETVPDFSVSSRWYLGEDSETRRRIAREQIEKFTGVKLEDSWEDEKGGYPRLFPDSKNSIMPKIEGQDILLIYKRSKTNEKLYWNVYFPWTTPKSLTMADFKKNKRVASDPGY